jgi:hypothetical protein
MAEDTATRSTVSSLTTPAWQRPAARILIVKGLFTADGSRMVGHNLVHQACRRESSPNYSLRSILEATSCHTPSADELNKLRTFSLAFS